MSHINCINEDNAYLISPLIVLSNPYKSHKNVTTVCDTSH